MRAALLSLLGVLSLWAQTAGIESALQDADAARGAGRNREAEAAYRRLLGVLPRSPEQTVRILAGLTAALMQAGKFADAQVEAARTLEQCAQLPSGQEVCRAYALSNLGTAQVSLGRVEEGEKNLRDGVAAAAHALGEDHFEVLRMLSNLAQSLVYRGEYARALPVLKRVLARSSVERPEDPRQLAHDHLNLGTAYLQLGEFTNAERHLHRAQQLSLDAWGRGHASRLETLGAIALLHLYREEWKPAEVMLDEALAESDSLGAEHPMVVILNSHRASLLAKTGRLRDATALQETVVRKHLMLYPANHRILLSSVATYGKMLDAGRDRRGRARVERWMKMLTSYPSGQAFSPKCPQGTDCCDYWAKTRERSK